MTRTVDPDKPYHIFKTAAVMQGHDLVVFRECAEAIYNNPPVLPHSIPEGGFPDTYQCRNCGNRGEILFRFLKFPTRYLPDKGIFVSHEGLYWRYEVKSWGCPLCQPDDRANLISLTLESSGLNPEDYNLDPALYLRDEDKAEAIQAALDVLSTLPRFSGFVTIAGAYGVGKTSLGKGVVAKACRAGYGARFIEAAQIVSEIQATFGKKDTDAQAIIATYTASPFLVIDEVMAGNETDWAVSQLRVVLNRRYERRSTQATLMLTNALPDEMRELWAYMESRMRDGVRVVMSGNDLRGQREAAMARLPYKDAE